VDRFYKKLQARQQYLDEKEGREMARVSPDRPVVELELSGRATEALAQAGITTVGQILDKLAQGEATLLALDGFGRKSMADMKKRLRQFGYELPQSVDEAVV
jgi:large subunit ribosomal protein L31